MTSKKTIIQGMDETNPTQTNAENGFYAPSANVKDKSRTYIPDIYKRPGNAALQGNRPADVIEIRRQDRQLVGVMYSISRSSFGEVFPVYIGRNMIGSDTSCDICLREESVSPNHAVLLVRKLSGEGEVSQLSASITDNDSRHGTMVGQQVAEYEKISCKDHDVISVGDSYKLLLCLFDTDKYKLSVDSGFKAMPLPKKKSSPIPNRHSVEIEEPMQTTFGLDSTGHGFYAPTKSREEDHSGNLTV